MDTFDMKRCSRILFFGLYISSILVGIFSVAVSAVGSSPSRKPAHFEFSFPTPDKNFDHGCIITAQGTHSLSPDDYVWILLRDTFRGYYVQNPPAELRADGKWEATNIRLGRDINYIIAIQVNREGNDIIEGWVKAKRFGKIEEKEIKALAGYRELSRVGINITGTECR